MRDTCFGAEAHTQPLNDPSVVDIIKHLETSAAHKLLVLVVVHAVEAVEAPAGSESLVQPPSLSLPQGTQARRMQNVHKRGPQMHAIPYT